MITPEMREALIEIYIRALDAVHPQAASATMLRTACRQAGLSSVLELRDHESLLEDLIEKGWVAEVPAASNPELKRYKRTEAGRIWLASLEA